MPAWREWSGSESSKSSPQAALWWRVTWAVAQIGLTLDLKLFCHRLTRGGPTISLCPRPAHWWLVLPRGSCSSIFIRIPLANGIWTPSKAFGLHVCPMRRTPAQRRLETPSSVPLVSMNVKSRLWVKFLWAGQTQRTYCTLVLNPETPSFEFAAPVKQGFPSPKFHLV
jgi:hypothetical protein